MAWIAAHPYLSLLALVLLAGSVLALCFHRSDKHARADQPAVGRATVVQPPDVARHRAGAVAKVTRDHTPLPAWERLQLAPTHHDPDVFVSSPGPSEHTRPMIAPRRDDVRPTLAAIAGDGATDVEREFARGLLTVHDQEARDA